MRNLIPSFIQEQYTRENYEGTFDALTMFVDVSGFTPLTQALMQQGHEGAEILAGILNTMFEVLINVVYVHGGFITGFAGDAFTAVFPIGQELMSASTSVIHGLSCADSIQAYFRQHGVHRTKFGEFPLQVKIGISCGEVRWGIVGKRQKLYFFRGAAIDGCAIAEHHAAQGDIIFDEHVSRLMTDPLVSDPIAPGYARLAKLPSFDAHQLTQPRLHRGQLSKEIVSRFFPESLMTFTEMGEFRNVVSIFISFEGISTLNEFDDWACVILDNISRFSGYFNRMNFGDKGGFVLCGFGAPVTFENIVDRALEFILAVKDDLPGFQSLAGLRWRAGITYGIAYAGITGGKEQCEYTYHGEVVNLAARFMMKADWGEILASEVVASKATHFTFVYKGDFLYKGITEPVPTHLLTGRTIETAKKEFTTTMVGRQTELQQLRAFVAPIFKGTFAGMAYIYGEPGIGKSHLVYALHEELLRHHDITWFMCPVDQIVRKPFNPFITCLMRYFGQSAEHSEDENRERFENRYIELIEKCRVLQQVPRMLEHIKELLRTKSIIGAQIGLRWEASLWNHLDARGKYENSLYAIKNFFLVHSLLTPVVIELEDSQWLDSDSLALLDIFTRNISHYPIAVVSTLRYYDDGTRPIFALGTMNTLELDLNYFSEEDVRRYAEAELQGDISEELFILLLEKTKGNPFFIQQMTSYFRENGLVAMQDQTWRLTTATLALPESISAVLIARIDRLTRQVKEVVKVASVLGRQFDILLLSAVLKQDVFAQIKLVEDEQIWEQLQELHYIFKHALLRDAAYEMQLRARLRELHQLTAEAMEILYGVRPEEKYADIAFHYERAENWEKAIGYLEKSGDEAKSKYHNQQALDFYDRALSHLKNCHTLSNREIDILLKKAEILDLIGKWQICQQVCENALQLAEQQEDRRRMGQAKLALGIVFRQTEQYDKAMQYFRQALDVFVAVTDKVGVGQVCKDLGIVYRRKGDYETAMRWYQKALRISEEIGDTLSMAKNSNNMGIACDLQGDYETAMQWYHKGLQICEALGEKLDKSKILNNIGENRRLQGNYDAAMEYYTQALSLEEELGDKLNLASTLSNVGLVYTVQADYETAITYFDRAIAILKELGNKYYLCECVIGKAEALFSLQRYAEAQALNGEGLRIAEDIGRKEYRFKGKILSVKIDYALGNNDAPNCFEEMLQQEHDPSELATLRSELWKMTRNDNSSI